MQLTGKQQDYLFRAIHAFKRKLIVISPDFRILAVNKQGQMDQDIELNGRFCYEQFKGIDGPCEHCPVLESLHTRTPTYIGKHDISQRKMACVFSYPLFFNGEIDALVVVDFDLPVQVWLEEQMNQSSTFLHNLLLSSVDGVVAADKTGKLVIFNNAVSEILGYTIDEALEKLHVNNIYANENEAADVMRKLRSEEYGGKGKLKGHHVDLLGKNGQRIPVRLNASIVYKDDQEVATIGFFRDLRGTIQMEKELEKTQQQLLQSEKMASLGKLAAGVAHQLNNPLGGIILFTKLVMEENELSTEVQEDLRRILRDAERCRDTVKELLEFSRQTRQFMQPCDINQAINRTMFLLESQPIFQNITIEKHLTDNLPQVHADTQQLNHMLMNIILNAVDAMDGKGKLTIITRLPKAGERIYTEDGDTPVLEYPFCWLPSHGDRLCIEISDTGAGIPEEVLPHIFDPFFTTKEEGKGTGLGLSMVYGIVENHGGNIIAKSKPGTGTTFIVTLPLAAQDMEGGERE
ncbi:MAG: PAS domain S-box protein [Deltaproteobacteria bacterium]|nr:PAS domain S-box protein [Candidatus Anaeroferrophillus wilburensis]MBN2889728.1 PAS domain S-box protein [Deltaproteobacteria bacterium]